MVINNELLKITIFHWPKYYFLSVKINLIKSTKIVLVKIFTIKWVITDKCSLSDVLSFVLYMKRFYSTVDLVFEIVILNVCCVFMLCRSRRSLLRWWTAYEWYQIICFPESFSKMSDRYFFFQQFLNNKNKTSFRIVIN